MSAEQTINERLDALERRMTALETQAKRIDEVAAAVKRIVTLLDGHDDLGVQGLRKQSAANGAAIAKLIKADETRGVQIDTIERLIKIVAIFVPAAATAAGAWQIASAFLQ